MKLTASELLVFFLYFILLKEVVSTIVKQTWRHKWSIPYFEKVVVGNRRRFHCLYFFGPVPVLSMRFNCLLFAYYHYQFTLLRDGTRR